MKVFLLILVVSTKAGQQPTIPQILQPDMMATCQAQTKVVREELRSHGCDKEQFYDPGYTVHTSCVTGS